jgi:mRNA interferase HigB
MRIVSKRRLQEFWETNKQAKKPLEEWHFIVNKANWKNFNDLRRTYSSADQVAVKSGNTTTVFDIGGNNYRLIAAVHYNTKTVYILDVMTHAVYNRDLWKDKF